MNDCTLLCVCTSDVMRQEVDISVGYLENIDPQYYNTRREKNSTVIFLFIVYCIIFNTFIIFIYNRYQRKLPKFVIDQENIAKNNRK